MSSSNYASSFGTPGSYGSSNTPAPTSSFNNLSADPQLPSITASVVKLLASARGVPDQHRVLQVLCAFAGLEPPFTVDSQRIYYEATMLARDLSVSLKGRDRKELEMTLVSMSNEREATTSSSFFSASSSSPSLKSSPLPPTAAPSSPSRISFARSSPSTFTSSSSLSSSTPSVNPYASATTTTPSSVSFAAASLNLNSSISSNSFYNSSTPFNHTSSAALASPSSTSFLPTFKVVIVGDAGVGKTAWVKRLQTGVFTQRELPSPGAEISKLAFRTQRGGIVFELWDCSGQPKHRWLMRGYLTGAQAVVILFDVTNPQSYFSTKSYFAEIQQVCGFIPVVLVGNKVDSFERMIRADKLVDDNSGVMPYCELSVQQPFNLYRPIQFLAQKLIGDPSLQIESSDDIPEKFVWPAVKEPVPIMQELHDSAFR
eukprot:GILI01009441.1.p1 GENE.GILI01009441.1~~GILI01009441.1.p1  ORF type:complete len:429 (+),score=128.03 GILI01009441.1:71-1357(+)